MSETIKIVIFGDSGTGKTSLMYRYMTNHFIEDIRLTIGVDFHVKIMKIGNKEIKLQIWDFGGEVRFRFLFPSYILGASGGIFMYDITNYSTL
ncbi:MAG: Rab family GTPase, partial [Promethearchaeota archaeon]